MFSAKSYHTLNRCQFSGRLVYPIRSSPPRIANFATMAYPRLIINKKYKSRQIHQKSTPKENLKMTLPESQKAVVITKHGDGYEVIKYTDIETPKITDPNEIIIHNKYAGINFIESYFRKGIYPVASFPYILGREASGFVAEVGSEVKHFSVGDKVAYLSGSTFAQYTKVSSKSNIAKLGDKDDLKVYGSTLIQALTAIAFVEESHKVQSGEFLLVWAAAGGVGSVLTQVASTKGARVIALASSTEKLNIAKSLGAEFVINYKTENVVEKVKEITSGKGVAAVYDSVGKDTFEISFETLARKGTFVSYGNSSGQVPPFAISRLVTKNAKILRPTVGNYLVEREEWDYYFNILKTLIDGKKLVLDISKTYELADYAEATKALEGGQTTGKLTLSIPE